ncbi:1-deoxy-D-xylulose 5-phosphate reductoisomerase [Candidatus Syntrophocurvum alkaliphilum]|uniref:1-deoxy-D-xylulose 5-phosphate reductoisomerase n=1 Tax=Candidatus Syntrophocurvum alkaliphilum TaxID=2293317 RepID=A0A6I6D8E1_9FIRM|nr:1-deoxy-D-xylulose-5-phosphate reductoisomerase [Candidatus Syntrophocurvum alkaliphilum]QGT99203.1 1-deoxy-D-xylulose 5-phosphate reductoisomerase [Candidatus Syntrophocurvum alkaliphilum]
MQKETNVVILGSSGSIGKQALEVIDKHNEKFNIIGLAAKDELNILTEQVLKYKPEYVVIGDEKYYSELKNRIDINNTEILTGVNGMTHLCALSNVDIVIVAVSGAIGILPTLKAIEAGKTIGLANKETLVSAGDIVMQKIKNSNSQMIPVDSEHSAVYQCLQGEERYLKNIWLTASGGPFRDYTYEQLEKVTLEQALRHPNWVMGPKITIDSATLMNKGLEVIEAHHLFDIDYENINVIVHKESIIHSMIELIDGSFIAHLGLPDMRIPIQYALTYPERLESPVKPLDFTTLSTLNFDKPDTKRFPALELAYQAGKQGGSMPAVLNAANEIAVDKFINGFIKFTEISKLVEEVMLKHQLVKNPSITEILEIDAWARNISHEF